MRALLLAALALVPASCGWLSFEKRKTEQELALEQSVRGYYDEVTQAFASGDSERLASLFSPAIAKPMTREQIAAWGRDFFRDHGPARFTVEKLEFDALGPRRAEALLTYRVSTRTGQGSFGGRELDVLERTEGGRWRISEWEKLR